MSVRTRRDTLRRILEGAAPAGTSEGIAVVLPVPRKAAAALALDDGLPPEELHLTLAYLGKVSDYGPERRELLRRVLTSWARDTAPIPARVGGIGRFAGGKDGDPVYLPVDAPRLSLRWDLTHRIADEGFAVSLAHGFTPHITLAYIQADEELPTQRVVSRAITFDTLSLWWGDDHTDFPLAGDPAGIDKVLREAPKVEQWARLGYDLREVFHA